jgi:hypothetical protein
MESVEPRRLLAAVAWDGGGDGVLWSDPANWSTNALPGLGDHVTINVAGSPTIVVDTPVQINSLVSQEALSIALATMLVEGPATLNAATRVAGGQWLSVVGQLTLNSTLTLGDAVTTTAGSLYIAGAADQTIAGTGAIAIDYSGGIYNYTYDPIMATGLDLTIPATIAVNSSGYASIYSTFAGGRIVNNTTITLTAPDTFYTAQLGDASTQFINNGTVSLGGGLQAGSLGFVNAGTLLLAPGTGFNGTNFINNPGRTINVTDATLTLLDDGEIGPGSWDNNGTIALGDNGVLNLGGFFVAGDLGTITRSGTNAVNLTGTLDNTAQVFTFNNTRGNWNLIGGTIRGGSIDRIGSNTLQIINGTLNGVTVNMPLHAFNGSSLLVENLTLNDVLTLGDSTSTTSGTLYVYASTAQTINGSGAINIDYWGGIYNYTYDPMTAQGLDLTIPASIEVNSNGYAYMYAAYTSGRIVNNSTLTFTAPANSYDVQLGTGATQFVNNGTINIGGQLLATAVNLVNNPGRTINISNASLTLNDDGEAGPQSWDNNGTIALTSNGSLSLGGFLTKPDIGAVTRTGTTSVQLTGILDNTADTWALAASVGSVTVVGGTVRGGIVQPSPAATFTIAHGTLAGVRLQGVTTVTSYALILGDLELDLATVNLGTAAGGAYLQFNDHLDQSILGSGDIVSLGSGSGIYNYAYDLVTGSGLNLALGVGIEVSGAGTTISSAYEGATITNRAQLVLNGGGIWQLGSTGTGGLTNFATVTLTNGTTASAAFVGDVYSLILDGPGVSMQILAGNYRFNQTVPVLNDAQLYAGEGWTLDADMNIGGIVIFDHGPGESVATDLRSRVITGYAGGAWTGPGLRSSAAAADSRTAVGYASSGELFPGLTGGVVGSFFVDQDAFVVRHTLKGDADLDRTVGFSDLLRLAQNYGLPSTWASGDFNYDGGTNFNDLLALAQQYGTSLAKSATSGLFSRRRIVESGLLA